MGKTITTDQLPEGGELQYNNPIPEAKKVIAPTLVQDFPAVMLEGQNTFEGGELLYNNPTDDSVVVPQEIAKAATADPAFKAADTTFSGYIGYKVDSLVKNIKQDFEDSTKRLDAAVENRRSGSISDFEMKLSGTGAVANFALDAIGEVVVNVAGTAGDAISYIVPDDIEATVKEGFKEGLDFVVNSPAGQAGLDALYSGVEAWDNYSKNNPRAAENIKSVVDVGLVLSPIKGGRTAKAGSVRDDVGKAIEAKGKALYESGAKDANAKTSISYLDSMSNTKQKGYMDRTRSIEKSIFSNEELAIKEAQSLAGYSSKADTPFIINKNHRLADQALIKAKAARDELVASSGREVSNAGLYDKITKNIDEALSDALDLESSDKAANRLLEITERSVGINGRTPTGLDLTRTDINNFIKRNVPESEINDMSNPLVAAGAAVRRALKESIEEAVPGYKEVQDKVIGLTRTKVGSGSKLALDSGSKIMNFIDSGLKTVGLSRDMAFMLSAVGVGGYAALSAPLIGVGVAGLAGFKALSLVNKGITVANGKKALGYINKIAGESIRNASGNAPLIRQIRADRAAMLELVRIGVENHKKGEIMQEEDMSPEENSVSLQAAPPGNDLEAKKAEFMSRMSNSRIQ